MLAMTFSIDSSTPPPCFLAKARTGATLGMTVVYVALGMTVVYVTLGMTVVYVTLGMTLVFKLLSCQ